MGEREIRLRVETLQRPRDLSFTLHHVVIAGWTGRNADDVEAHIRELEAIGVARPKTVPIFYRVSSNLIATNKEIQVAGNDSSGEAEVVLIYDGTQIFISVGSDHTDRKLETVGVTWSKQVCPKPISATVWPFAEVSAHWDRMQLESAVGEDARIVYQAGTTAKQRRPEDLMELYRQRFGALLPGTIMFCGTPPIIGSIRYETRMRVRLVDPVLKRELAHDYRIERLPIVD